MRRKACGSEILCVAVCVFLRLIRDMLFISCDPFRHSIFMKVALFVFDFLLLCGAGCEPCEARRSENPSHKRNGTLNDKNFTHPILYRYGLSVFCPPGMAFQTPPVCVANCFWKSSEVPITLTRTCLSCNIRIIAGGEDSPFGGSSVTRMK